MSEPHSHIEDEQRHVAQLVRSFDAPAPQSLHRQIDSLVSEHQDRRFPRRASPRRRFSTLGLASAGAAILAVVAVAIAMSGGSSSSAMPDLRQAAAPTLRAATLPAPAQNGAHRAQLAVAVGGVPFPYWEDRFGWHSTGARTDRLDGRSIVTVFYGDTAGRRIGYAILNGTPAPRIGGGTIVWRDGVAYRMLSNNGATVVTWLRDGHLCVVSGRGVSSATLLRLASWSDSAATSS
ncbi:MAG TPA: hypothetical protein VN845_12750 [Solirubrobacteraceae bacterium]|nr:hypothetical protein [Solirubrobacteraceae bacterium]